MKLGPYRLNTVVTGDARELSKAIPDDSVDMIICDPLFPNVDDYRWLAHMAARVLKPGGNLIAESGRVYLPQVMAAMSKSKLTWVDLLVEVFPLAVYRVVKSRVMIGYSPYLWYSKGKRNGAWTFDRYYSKGKDKRFHEYGDNIGFFLMYLGLLTSPGDIILDPFAGGMTVAAACKTLGDRHCLSFEINAATARAGRARIKNLPPPLPGMSPEQITLMPDLPNE